jgi:hypothetical protein
VDLKKRVIFEPHKTPLPQVISLVCFERPYLAELRAQARGPEEKVVSRLLRRSGGVPMPDNETV